MTNVRLLGKTRSVGPSLSCTIVPIPSVGATRILCHRNRVSLWFLVRVTKKYEVISGVASPLNVKSEEFVFECLREVLTKTTLFVECVRLKSVCYPQVLLWFASFVMLASLAVLTLLSLTLNYISYQFLITISAVVN